MRARHNNARRRRRATQAARLGRAAMGRGSLILAGWLVLLVPGWSAGETPESTVVSNRSRQTEQTGAAGSEPLAKFQGARSCAATACHGSVAPDVREGHIGRHEYLFWFDRDPHARAGRDLVNERGTSILERLGARDRKGQILKPEVLANCQGCHDPQPPKAQRGLTFALNEGVGCEQCHGASERWIGDHYRGEGTRAKAEGLGMRFTKSPEVRASVCMPCHVGSPQFEVNHDLIAAGHPALKFEFAAYHDLLPKHWNESRDRGRTKQLELELWLAGQLASLQASLELTAARAERAFIPKEAPAGIWPEFAEHDCFACHHQLEGSVSWRSERGYAGKAGSAPQMNWYGVLLAGVPTMETKPTGLPATGIARGGAELERVRMSLQSLRRVTGNGARPDAIQIHEEAQLAATLVRGLRSSLTMGSAEAFTNELLGRWREKPEQAVYDWDTATQVYLLLAAQDRDARRTARAGLRSNEIAPDQRLIGLRDALAFPAGYDSPREFGRVFEGSGEEVRLVARKKFEELFGTGKPIAPLP